MALEGSLTLEAGQVFMVSPSELPRVSAQLVAESVYGGWLVACFFGGEPDPGVIATVDLYDWFERGRWQVSHVAEVLDIPLPVAVVYSGGKSLLYDFYGRPIREARSGELELLGRPKSISPIGLLKACKAYAGLIGNTPRYEDMTAESYFFKIDLLNEAGL